MSLSISDIFFFDSRNKKNPAEAGAYRQRWPNLITNACPPFRNPVLSFRAVMESCVIHRLIAGRETVFLRDANNKYQPNNASECQRELFSHCHTSPIARGPV
jgi:hypothetical protein